MCLCAALGHSTCAIRSCLPGRQRIGIRGRRWHPQATPSGLALACVLACGGVVRRLFAKAISERLPEDDRADGLVVLQWLLGLRWLPPPLVSELEPRTHAARAHSLF